MNKLTGPAKAAFERWFFETHGKCSKKFEEILPWQKAEIFDWLNEACETIQHAFLIEFFDSVGIYIWTMPSLRGINRWTHRLFLKFQEGFVKQPVYIYNTRIKATSKALDKANEIFNNLNH